MLVKVFLEDAAIISREITIGTGLQVKATHNGIWDITFIINSGIKTPLLVPQEMAVEVALVDGPVDAECATEATIGLHVSCTKVRVVLCA